LTDVGDKPLTIDAGEFSIVLIGAGVVSLAVAQGFARNGRGGVLLEKNGTFGREGKRRKLARLA